MLQTLTDYLSLTAHYLSPGAILAVGLVAVLLSFALFAFRCLSQASPAESFSFHTERSRWTGRDSKLCLLLTFLYALTAFFSLGSTTAPQTKVDFVRAETVLVQLDEPVYVAAMRSFSGLGTGSYNVELSSDGSHWSTLWPRKDDEGTVTGYYWANAEGYAPSYALKQDYNSLFKWKTISFENPQNMKYLRVTGQAERDTLQLCELVFYSDPEATLPLDLRGHGSLLDEADTAPAAETWFNSAYFDEIYHPRTALEHIENMRPYETTHPPLGKLLIGLGIRLFGMTPFGWRFTGTLFGVLMLPLLYVLVKLLFGSTLVAACGTALFATDFMHLTQTRIATIDTYAVFFILAAYLFLYRWLSLPPTAGVKEGVFPLFLAGLFFGIGAASKWTVLYAGAGMAVLYALHFLFRWKDRNTEGVPAFWPWAVKTVLLSVLFFVIIPLCIYTLSYWPYAVQEGDTSLSGLVRVMWENQGHMFHYHQGVTTRHPYQSDWWMWLLDGRPILYYMEDTAATHTRFAAFLNPLLCWGGLLAVGLTGRLGWKQKDGKALFIVVGYLAQLVPWIPISRPTFHYHYFPCVPFLVLALCWLLDGLLRRDRENGFRWVVGLTGGSAILYAAFYPVLIGLTIPTWYSTLLRWLPSWPF